MDEAEKWLAAHDPDYETASLAWKHVRTGEYVPPAQEIPVGGLEDLQLIVSRRAGQYVEHGAAAAERACLTCSRLFEPREAKHRFCSRGCFEKSRVPRGRASYMRDFRARQREDSEAEAGVLYDLGANLRPGNPFAAAA